jgi:serine/threonine protein kinase
VRVVDIVNQVRRKANEGTNFVRYPVQVISQAVRRVGQQWYENAQLPGGETPQSGDRVQGDRIQGDRTEAATYPTAIATASAAQRSPDPYPVTAYSGVQLISGTEATKNLPNRQLDTPIRSRWNSYTVGACLEMGERMRLYEGKTRSDEPVLIKEYLLSHDDLSAAQLEERFQAFERLIELNQKIGNGPDFRIVKLVDAIALPKEKKCYLITKPINHNTTLETYLSEFGWMSAKQIREVLRQVLESLRFLHTAYRVYFSSGESERGLPHGNLSLKSLLVRQVDIGGNGDRQFFIYLTDLELWEHLFYPLASPDFHPTVAKSAHDLGSVKQDLADLGLISLHLAGGALIPAEEQRPELTEVNSDDLADPALRHFIQRLIGVIAPFNTAEEALHTLLQLPEPSQLVPAPTLIEAAEERPAARKEGLILALALILGLVGLIGLLTWWMRREPLPSISTSPLPSLLDKAPQVSKVQDVDVQDVDVRNPISLTYIVEPEGTWHYAMARRFISNAAPGGNSSRSDLLSAIADRHPEVNSITRIDPKNRNIIDQLENGAADVALMQMPIST